MRPDRLLTQTQLHGISASPCPGWWCPEGHGHHLRSYFDLRAESRAEHCSALRHPSVGCTMLRLQQALLGMHLTRTRPASVSASKDDSERRGSYFLTTKEKLDRMQKHCHASRSECCQVAGSCRCASRCERYLSSCPLAQPG